MKITLIISFKIQSIKINQGIDKGPNVRSSDIAKRIDIPLSTIQRRSKLENSILKKNYEIVALTRESRNCFVFVHAEEGKAEEIGKKILEEFPTYVLKVSTGSY